METAMNAMTSTLAAGTTITELAPTTRIALRVADPAGVGIALGVPLPGRIGSRAANGARSALCLGPDEWLIEAPETEAGALVAAIADLRAQTPISTVEVSDREITWRLEGPRVLDLLAAGCPRDLARMPVGGGARTLFDNAQVVLTREAEDRFHLTVWRSFAPHVRAILDLATRELATGL
jgi:sarcosine oxidase, subunit gamma